MNNLEYPVFMKLSVAHQTGTEADDARAYRGFSPGPTEDGGPWDMSKKNV